MKVQLAANIKDEDLKILWRSYLDRYGKRSQAFLAALRDLKEVTKEVNDLKSKLDILIELVGKEKEVK